MRFLPALVLGAAIAAHGQLPDAPKPQPITKQDWSLLAADASVRALDVYSTHKMLQGPNHELFLPDAIAHHTPVLVVYSGAVVTANWLVMRKLERKHPKLAHTFMAVDVAQDGFWAVHDLFLPTK